jgi:hypothetical protein
VLFSGALSAGDSTFTDQFDNKRIFRITDTQTFDILKEKGRKLPTYRVNVGNDSVLMMTLFPADNRELAAIKSMVEMMGRRLLPDSKETELEVLDLRTANALGYYYELSDKHDKPEEYKYISQGYLLVPGGAISFTFLCNDEARTEFTALKKLFNAARIEKDPSYRSPFAGVMITANDVDEGAVFGERLLLKTFQILTYLEAPDAYASIMPPPVAMEVQSIALGDDMGSIIYFKYGEDIGDKAGFLHGLFFGEHEPGSEEHPEEMFLEGDLMIILSYPLDSELKQRLKKRLLEKL